MSATTENGNTIRENAKVIEVIDGDTIDVEARIWLGQTVKVRVRIDGIDTPELQGKCEDERKKAKEAKRLLESVIGTSVELRHIRYGKYSGRVVSRVIIKGVDVAGLIIKAGLGRIYHGEKRNSWCD